MARKRPPKKAREDDSGGAGGDPSPSEIAPTLDSSEIVELETIPPEELPADTPRTPSPLRPSGDLASPVPEAEKKKETKKKDENRLGPFVLLEPLGEGGMGVVYKARDERLNRIVALKTIRGELTPTAVKRFRREAEAIARLRHPAIVSVHEVGEEEGVQWLAMDLIEGSTLSKRLKDGLSPKLGVAIVRDVARAIQYAHEHGVVHRDLKPQNVMLDKDDKPYVLDFGLARVAGNERSKVTRTGAALGTPAYMPPEQAGDSPHPVDERSDVYALGATLYHVLTGRPPFSGQNDLQVLAQVLTREPRPPSAYQARFAGDLDTIVLKALEKLPRRRFASAREFADDLDRHLRGEPIVARPLGGAQRLARGLSRHRTIVLVVALILLALLIAFGMVRRHLKELEAEFQRKQKLEEEKKKQLVEALEKAEEDRKREAREAQLKERERERQLAEAREREKQLEAARIAEQDKALEMAKKLDEEKHKAELEAKRAKGSGAVAAPSDGAPASPDLGEASAVIEATATYDDASFQAVAYVKGGWKLVTADSKGRALRWTSRMPSADTVLGELGAPSRLLAVAPDETHAVFAAGHRIVHWDLGSYSANDDARKLITIETTHEVVTALAYPLPDRALTGGKDGKVCLWDLVTDTARWTATAGSTVLSLAVSPDAKIALVTTAEGYLRRFEVETGREIGNAIRVGRVTQLHYVTGLGLVGADPDSGPYLIGLADPKGAASQGVRRMFSRRQPGRVGVEALAVSPDGKLVATVDLDGWVRLFHAKTFQCLDEFMPSSPPTALAFAPEKIQGKMRAPDALYTFAIASRAGKLFHAKVVARKEAPRALDELRFRFAELLAKESPENKKKLARVQQLLEERDAKARKQGFADALRTLREARSAASVPLVLSALQSALETDKDPLFRVELARTYAILTGSDIRLGYNVPVPEMSNSLSQEVLAWRSGEVKVDLATFSETQLDEVAKALIDENGGNRIYQARGEDLSKLGDVRDRFSRIEPAPPERVVDVVGPRVLEKLFAHALGERSRVVRTVAVLRKSGRVPELEDIACDENRPISHRQVALLALWRAQEKVPVEPALAIAKSDGGLELRVPAIYMLGSLRRDAAKVAPVLEKLLQASQVEVRVAALDACWELGAKAAPDATRRVLLEGGADEVEETLVLLGSFHVQASREVLVEFLRKALMDGPWKNRHVYEALRSLSRCSSGRGFEPPLGPNPETLEELLRKLAKDAVDWWEKTGKNEK